MSTEILTTYMIAGIPLSALLLGISACDELGERLSTLLRRIAASLFVSALTAFLWLPWAVVILSTIWTANTNAANRVFPGDQVLPIEPRQIAQPHPADLKVEE